jgi:transcriptional regulator with AAA-type ATPase domain
VIPIHLPPLRERKEDIPLLAEYFLEKCSRDIGKHFYPGDRRGHIEISCIQLAGKYPRIRKCN